MVLDNKYDGVFLNQDGYPDIERSVGKHCAAYSFSVSGAERSGKSSQHSVFHKRSVLFANFFSFQRNLLLMDCLVSSLVSFVFKFVFLIIGFYILYSLIQGSFSYDIGLFVPFLGLQPPKLRVCTSILGLQPPKLGVYPLCLVLLSLYFFLGGVL